MRGLDTHDEKTDDGDDRDKDLTSRSEGELEEKHQRLRSSKLIQRLDGRRAEEDEKEKSCAEPRRSASAPSRQRRRRRTESHDTSNSSGPEDSSGRGERGILDLLSDVGCEGEEDQPSFKGSERERRATKYSPAASKPVIT